MAVTMLSRSASFFRMYWVKSQVKFMVTRASHGQTTFQSESGVPRLLHGRLSRTSQFTTSRELANETLADISVNLSEDKRLNVTWGNKKSSKFHSIWLRDNCHCDRCKQPQSGQKLFNILDTPNQLTIVGASVKDDQVEITWDADAGHTGIIPLEFLRENCYESQRLKNRDDSLKPKYSKGMNFPVIQFAELQKSVSSSNYSETLLRLMTNISENGACLVKNTPVEEDMAVTLAEMIAPIQQTIYGKTFDVISTPEPINIAYSSVSLDLHMDLAYYESPPGLQVFHCLRFDDCVEGGLSLFLDAFQIAEEFRESFPDEFQDLTRIPATFQKIHFQRERPVFITYQRPHITLNHREQITGVFWSPAFEGPVSVPEEDVEPYYSAYRLFMKSIHESKHLKTLRLSPGDTIIFNNRRLLHGRTEFQLNGGVRKFKGCYLNIDEFNSHFRYLSHVMHREHAPTRLGNQCWF